MASGSLGFPGLAASPDTEASTGSSHAGALQRPPHYQVQEPSPRARTAATAGRHAPHRSWGQWPYSTFCFHKTQLFPSSFTTS